MKTMQMRLVFSALSFLVNYVEQIASIYTFGVCKLPRLDDDDFRSKCAPFSQKSGSFICDMWIGLTLTEVENFRQVINGRFATCQCEKVTDQLNGGMICFNETITSNLAEPVHNQVNSSKLEKSILNSDLPDLTLSIVYISLSDRITAEISNRNPSAFKDVKKNNCEPNNKLSPSSVIYDYSLSNEQYKTEFLEFHRRILKNRWKTKTCATDIIIFAFDDGGEPKSGQQLSLSNEDNLTNAIEELKRTVHVEASAKAKKAYGEQLAQLTTKINQDYPDMNPADKIRRLLEQLTALEPSRTDGLENGIPRWAVITFVSCICISILAVIVGNFVNDDSARKRKSSPMAGKSKSKSPWKAGFSGGMWAV